jgi:capsular exopolysaccharide synthesis family protein
MSKVFEALERQQKQRGNNDGRDPLAAETGVPDNPAHAGAAPYELPATIGAPTGPLSNDGMLFPSLHAPLYDGGEPAPAAGAHANGAAAAAGVARGKSPVLVERPLARVSREIPVERVALAALHPRLIMLTDPAAMECEQFRTLRTQLFLAAEKKPTQVIIVSSALAGEGKTSTVLNLAVAISQSKEKRVLVIDGDLRRPSIAEYLGVKPTVGLGGVLAGECAPLDAVVCLDAQELYVMPVAVEAPNPTELLSSERLAMMVEEMREYFDFILVDSPPIMPFADARLLTNHADALLLVVRAGAAPYETVEKAIDLVPPGRILGVVLNDTEHLFGPDYYDYYYNHERREARRRTVWDRVRLRIGESWLGRKMDLRE